MAQFVLCTTVPFSAVLTSMSHGVQLAGSPVPIPCDGFPHASRSDQLDMSSGQSTPSAARIAAIGTMPLGAVDLERREFHRFPPVVGTLRFPLLQGLFVFESRVNLEDMILENPHNSWPSFCNVYRKQ